MLGARQHKFIRLDKEINNNIVSINILQDVYSKNDTLLANGKNALPKCIKLKDMNHMKEKKIMWYTPICITSVGKAQLL